MKRHLGVLGLAVLVLAADARADGRAAQAIEDPDGGLARFYQALAKVSAKQPGAIVRILNYGDSFTSNDSITRRLRERLQETYGDGGAGWVPFALPSPSFRHFTVKRTHKGWTVKNVTFKRLPDKRYGINGAAFEGSAGAESTFMTMKTGTLGTRVARWDVYYLAQPGGGAMSVTLDGEPHGTIDTAGDRVASAFHSIEAPDGAHTLKLRVTRGRVRVFAVVMETAGPGITYDNLGLASNSARALLGMDATQLAEQHARRAADLIVVHLGGNGADWFSVSQKAFARYQQVHSDWLAKLRAAAPKAPCLVMSSTDMGTRAGGIRTKPAIPGIVAAQRKAALANGCAFWDAFAFMGGPGSVKRWLAEGDWTTGLNHPNPSGAARLADGLVDALIAGFEARPRPNPKRSR